MSASDTYARLYHKFAYEFPAIYANDRLLAPWVRLLMVADASWPMRPPIPRSVPVRSWNTLVDCGLVLPDGDTYTIRGLDAERTRRRDAGRTGAAKRWENDRNADRSAIASAVAMPNRTEQSNTPPTPLPGGRRANAMNPRAIEARKTAAAQQAARRAQQLLVAHNNGAHADESHPDCRYCIERAQSAIERHAVTA